MSVGENIKRYRSDKAMSQSELAEAVGVTQSMVSQIERGTKALNVQLGKQIADALVVNLDDLIA